MFLIASYTANIKLQYRTPKRCAIAVPQIYPYKFASTVKNQPADPGRLELTPNLQPGNLETLLGSPLFPFGS